jgi:chitinase
LSIDGSPTAVEGEFLQFLLTLSEPASENVSFDIQTTDQTATAPDDYESKMGRRLFAAGETERKIWVRTVDDQDVEGDETLELTLSNVENAKLGISSASGKIVDNDVDAGPVTLSVADARASEGQKARFEVRLSRPATEDVVFRIRTINGTAFASGDFDAKTGNRTIAAGEIGRSIFIALKTDDRDEGQEQFQLQINAKSDNAINGDVTATGTIDDVDSDPVTLDVADARAAEGQYARFNVSLSKPTDEDVVFSVRTINGTAFAGGDFAAKTGNRRIAAGETERTIFVELKADDREEGQEQFQLQVTARSDNAVNGRTTATGTIDDR